MERVLAVYTRLGFPGCLGSMDCTHVRWLRCPFHLLNSCHGKEGFPTLAFQVLVDHGRQIRHVSQSFYGAMNDINVCRVDPIVRDDTHGLLSGDGNNRNRYKEVEFTVYDKDGQPIVIRGAYIITDGGYEPLAIFVNPNVSRMDRAAVVWAEFIEAIRKDVECTFGILKSRFHFLKIGSRYATQKVVESAFITACILHNMLLTLDGLDIGAWELDAAWDSIAMDPRLWNVDQLASTASTTASSASSALVALADDDGFVPFAGLTHLDESEADGIVAWSPGRIEPRSIKVIGLKSPNTLRELLIEHFSVSYRLGRVQWPKNMKQSTRFRVGRPQVITEPKAILRALSVIRESLIVKKSCLRRYDDSQAPGRYFDTVGNGLFTDMRIRKDEVIAEFIGEVIMVEEAEARTRAGCGGNMIEVRGDRLLDCYNYLDVCKASMANSPRHCINVNTKEKAIANARLVIDTMRKKYKLVCKSDIGLGEEIIWDYGLQYL